MATWMNVLEIDALRDGCHQVVMSPVGAVILFRRGEDFFAMKDMCTHDGGELGSGVCEGDEIVCPRHGARFCVRSGAVLSAPAYEDLEACPVQLREGWVQIDVD
ncbi:MAG: Rieske 2Fe-2S domain-containing protein [Zetaproteobacteria bacterium]|nr:Rieske 2Fe-2S domain-containing protein [Zetaproteobacteria bacterium]